MIESSRDLAERDRSSTCNNTIYTPAHTSNGTVRGGPYFVFLGGGYHGGK